MLTSEVFAKKHASEMGEVARGATMVPDELRWRKEQDKFPVRPRLS